MYLNLIKLQDLEEALLTDGGAEGRLVQELIVKLLEGCLPNDTRNDISTFNYQMFLRRLFRKKCQVSIFSINVRTADKYIYIY